jgi:hypothetical protein
MSLRFYRRFRIVPGVRLNLGLHGAGFSVGPRGLHVGINRRGSCTSAGIPGTGLYAVHHSTLRARITQKSAARVAVRSCYLCS